MELTLHPIDLFVVYQLDEVADFVTNEFTLVQRAQIIFILVRLVSILDFSSVFEIAFVPRLIELPFEPWRLPLEAVTFPDSELVSCRQLHRRKRVPILVIDSAVPFFIRLSFGHHLV